MKRPRLALALVAAALPLAPSAAQAAPCSALPSNLTLSLGGYPVILRTVSWDAKRHALLVRDSFVGGHRRLHVLHPTCLRWQRFWRGVELARVWQWQRE